MTTTEGLAAPNTLVSKQLAILAEAATATWTNCCSALFADVHCLATNAEFRTRILAKAVATFGTVLQTCSRAFEITHGARDEAPIISGLAFNQVEVDAIDPLRLQAALCDAHCGRR